jgi:hypothetical protein
MAIVSRLRSRLYGLKEKGFAMSRHGVKHTHRKLTTDESNQVAKARRLIAAEEPEIRSKAREYKLASEAARSASKDSLKQTRAKADDGKPRERG